MARLGIMKKAVVIDDDLTILEVVKTMLEEENFRVQTIDDPRRAEKVILEETPPDIVLMDIQMDPIDGVTLCRKLKNKPLKKPVPIILMTAGPYLKEKAKRAHADGVLQKPFGFEELLETTSKFIKE